MFIDLHGSTILLRSKDQRINTSWQHLFDYELASHSIAPPQKKPNVVLFAEVKSSLPPAPISCPSFVSSELPLEVYTDQNQLTLRLRNTGQILFQFAKLSASSSSDPSYSHIVITESGFQTGIFQNITTLALGPLLRRRGLFLIHAFTAAINNRAVMFVGPSGSGKTSSGLTLVSSGWHFLANDMALMSHKNSPLALLSPGSIQTSPLTFALLPQLNFLLERYPLPSQQGKASIPRLEFIDPNQALLAASLTTIFFPTIGKTEHHQLNMVPRAVGLAKLMESSMDRWDIETLDDHIGFLEQLSHHVEFYELFLGHVMTDLPDFLETALAAK